MLLLPQRLRAQPLWDAAYFDSLQYNHDLNLPAWGPYTKKYIGVSHIPDEKKGIRFDLSVFPGFYRRKVEVPHAFYESGFHPWEASPNLEYFSFRHELEWQDRVYADISYSEIGADARLVRVEWVNNTDLPQSTVVHMMASVHFPSIKEYDPETPLNYSTLHLPDYAVWTDALDYTAITFAEASPQDQLVYDGKLRGEIRDHGLINGSGIGQGFGKKKGDQLVYACEVKEKIGQAVIWFRYKMEKGQEVSLKLNGLTNKQITLVGTGDFAIKTIEVGALKPGKHRLEILSAGSSPIAVDGFALVEERDVHSLKVEGVNWDYVPEILEGPVPNSLLLKYKNVDTYYGLYWDYPDFEVREWFQKDLDDTFKRMVNDHTKKVFRDGTDGHFTNVFLRPVSIDPHSTLAIDGLVCTGTKAAVEKRLKSGLNAQQAAAIYEAARENLVNYDIVPAGEKYLFSQQRMAATTITNVVYPVYTQRQYIRHHSPGRWWDCLYTWDSGFIGIGLSELNIQRGIENLNAYVNEPDEQSAFIHHGTPLPVQHYLFLELWNKTQSGEFLKAYYPKLKRYYEFIAGTNPSATTRMNSNLIRTWDYFYNSAGWDDYPPQKFVHAQGLRQSVTPVANTAHCIRIARILQMAATQLDLKKEALAYENDIQLWSKALQEHAWDPQTGYFGYVQHDEAGQARGIMKYDEKINYNMGLGGAYPLVAGSYTVDQKARLLTHLQTPGQIWSAIGLSAVDQSAPYYSPNGYWNGTVWMPHQWFYWKTMLDLGEADFAYQIAGTALDVWKKEVESTYNCFEHFVIETGRGAGWHQFGGLSAPVLSWFNAYYRQGTLTTGFDVWVEEKTVDETHSSLQAQLHIFGTQSDQFSMIACLNPQYSYEVYWNGQLVAHREIHKGTLSISLPNNGAKIGVLRIEPSR